MNTDKRKHLPAGRQGLTPIVVIATLFLLLATHVFAKPASSAPPTSSTDLIERAKEYDGKIVSFQGEVVGDIMRRGDFAWINIHDGKNALGIWAKSPLVVPVTFTGGYKYTGDIIEVKGVFHRACLEHGGDLDIHADSLSVLKIGQKRIEAFQEREKRWIFSLIGVTICLLILRAWRRA